MRISPSSLTVLLVAVSGALPLWGCSFVYVVGPPPTTQQDCTRSLASPVADTVFAVPGAALVTAAALDNPSACPAGMPNCHEDDSDALGRLGDTVAVVIGLAEMIPFAASAIYGFSKVDECKSYPAPSPSPNPSLRTKTTHR
jgi:hypothetical protein